MDNVQKLSSNEWNLKYGIMVSAGFRWLLQRTMSRVMKLDVPQNAENFLIH
jgi:hypothetical protein